MIWAQANELRECGERYLLRKVLLDIGGDDPLLPSGEPAPDLRTDARRTAMETHELMHEHDAERFRIQKIL
jgi:hypothetical protein